MAVEACLSVYVVGGQGVRPPNSMFSPLLLLFFYIFFNERAMSSLEK